MHKLKSALNRVNALRQQLAFRWNNMPEPVYDASVRAPRDISGYVIVGLVFVPWVVAQAVVLISQVL